jgi:hypothetical protein
VFLLFVFRIVNYNLYGIYALNNLICELQKPLQKPGITGILERNQINEIKGGAALMKTLKNLLKIAFQELTRPLKQGDLAERYAYEAGEITL